MQNPRGKKKGLRGATDKINENRQLEEFFLNSLKDIYWAEKHLTRVVPKLIEAATTEELRKVLEEQLESTKDQVTKLENVFELINEKPQAKKCEAMEGLTHEADTLINETEEGSLTRDVAIIMATQKVKHYEIATYGSLVHLAGLLGKQDVASILHDILDEEKEEDMTLTGVAENNIDVEVTSQEKE